MPRLTYQESERWHLLLRHIWLTSLSTYEQSPSV